MTAAPALKAALVAALTTLFPSPVLVTYGPPGTDEPDDIVSVLDVTVASAVDSPLMTGRTEEITVTVVFSCVSGDDDQQVVTERAYSMLGDFEDYLRSTDPTIGGTVLGNGGVIEQSMTETAVSAGRVSELTARVLAIAEMS